MNDLSSLPAGERLQALITEWSAEAELLSIEEMRKLFVYAWPDGRGSVDDERDNLLGMLHFIAPVRDSETYLSGTLTIFHAGDDEQGILWTLDEAEATAEAAGGTTFTASIDSSDVLAHLSNGGRNDVLVDRNDLSSVERAGPGRGHHFRL